MPCFNCEQFDVISGRGDVAARDRVHLGAHWRIAHAWSSMPGWMVVISNRHVASMAELTAPEARELGLTVRAVSVALERVVGCAKTYVVSYGEVEGFEHLHVHVVPRAPDLAVGERGGAIFAHLKAPAASHVPEDERDRISAEVGSVILEELGGTST